MKEMHTSETARVKNGLNLSIDGQKKLDELKAKYEKIQNSRPKANIS